MIDLKNRNIKSGMFRFFLKIRKSHLLFLGTVVVCLVFSGALQAQEVKRIDKVKAFFNNDIHSAKKAIIYSAIIPGWGQAYNRKYWKIPIVYAGFGAIGYFVKTNHDQYKLYKSYYQIMKADPDAQPFDGASIGNIRIDIDNFRRTRDLSIVGLAAWYGLNLIDANVDGHFFNYDVDEDLSLSIDPWVSGYNDINQGVGISFNLRWR